VTKWHLEILASEDLSSSLASAAGKPLKSRIRFLKKKFTAKSWWTRRTLSPFLRL
jgi:hypothetical protein